MKQETLLITSLAYGLKEVREGKTKVTPFQDGFLAGMVYGLINDDMDKALQYIIGHELTKCAERNGTSVEEVIAFVENTMETALKEFMSTVAATTSLAE